MLLFQNIIKSYESKSPYMATTPDSKDHLIDIH